MRVTLHRADDVDRNAYLRGLNECFPGWGGDERFDWCFSRTMAGRLPDLFVIRDGDALVAGSALTYRTLELTDGSRVRAAIMTGSWTLPAARGRGAFTRLATASLETAHEREASMMLGFVTAVNASRRALVTLGAGEIPTYYCRLKGTPTAPLPEVAQPSIRFVYSEDEWESQFVARPGGTERLTGDGWSALIERAGTTDRILHLDGRRDAAIAQLASRGRELFLFATARPAGLDVTEGFLMFFGSREPAAPWNVQNGDRM